VYAAFPEPHSGVSAKGQSEEALPLEGGGEGLLRY